MTKNLFVNFIVFLFTCLQPFAQGDLKKDLPLLSEVFKDRQMAADFVIVVDRSGSMSRYWGDVTKSISALVGAIPDGDYVSILGFDSNCSELVLSRKINSKTRLEIASDMQDLRPPTGGYTDLFNSTNILLDELNRPNSNNLKIVFYFTDFEHDPPPGSKWPKGVSSSQLAEKYSGMILKSGKLTRIFGMQLPLSPNAGVDFDRFTSIFGGTVTRVNFTNSQTLVEWFDKFKLTMAREKLKILALDELRVPLTLTGTAQTTFYYMTYIDGLSIELTNNSKLVIHVGSVNILLSDGTSIVKEVNQQVKPGEIISPEVGINYTESDSVTPQKISVEYSLLPVEESAMLGFDGTRRMEFNPRESFAIRQGLTMYGYLALMILALILIWIVWKIWFRPEYVLGVKKGRITVRIFYNDTVQDQHKTEFPANTSGVTIGRELLKDPDSEVPSFKIYIIPVKPRFFRLSPKRGTILYAEPGIRFKMSYTIMGKDQRTDLPVSRENGIRVLPSVREFTIEGENYYRGRDNNVRISITKY